MIVVSHDGFNQAPAWKSIIVIPISTSASQGERGLTVVEIPGGTAGLPRTSFAVCHQVTTLDRAELTIGQARIGKYKSATSRLESSNREVRINTQMNQYRLLEGLWRQLNESWSSMTSPLSFAWCQWRFRPGVMRFAQYPVLRRRCIL